MKKLIKLGYIMLICLFVSGCILPARSRAGFSVDVTSPLNGTVFTLPSSEAPTFLSGFPVYAKANAADGGVVSIVYYANGRVIGTDSTPDAATGDSSILWIPPAAGEYFLQAEAQRAHVSALSSAIRVCVLEGINILASGYSGPCPIPPPDPSAPAGGSVEMTATANPGGVAYSWEACPTPSEYVISFEASVNDISDRVALVYVMLQITGNPSATDEYSGVIVLNWTASAPSGEKIFTGSTTIQSVAFANVLDGGIGSLEWTARAVDRGNVSLVDEEPHFIPAAPCELPVIGIPMPLIIAPTDTLIPTQTLTPTPTSTPTLIPYIPPTKKPNDDGGSDNGGGGTVSCTLDATECSKLGLNFDKDNCKCVK